MKFYGDAYEAALDVARILANEMIQKGYFARVHVAPGEFTFWSSQGPGEKPTGFLVLAEKVFSPHLRIFRLDDNGCPAGKGERLALSLAEQKYRRFLDS